MAFTSDLLESLLYEEEGSSLDFKSEQYPFDRASKSEKAELLKDILAFANSWRRTEAYILIGVEEVKGGRSKVLGVNTHLDDAKLHQFVNSKTQRAVEFSYRVVQVERVQIGVIEVALQERPVYLKKRFGNLPESEVYIRDGSSTRVATPDEIARMGSQRLLEETPQFTLEWADLDSRTPLPSPCVLHSLVLYPPLPERTYALPQPSIYSGRLPQNPNYSEEVIMCTFERAFFTGVGVRLYNDSAVLGKNIRFEGILSKSCGAIVQETLERIPSKDTLAVPIDPVHLMGQEPEIHLKDIGNRWEFAVEFGDIRPREVLWTTDPFWFGCARTSLVKLEGQLIGDNSREPVPCSLEIKFEANQRPMTKDDAAPYLDP